MIKYSLLDAEQYKYLMYRNNICADWEW